MRKSDAGKYKSINPSQFFDRYHQPELSRSGTKSNNVNISCRHIKKPWIVQILKTISGGMIDKAVS